MSPEFSFPDWASQTDPSPPPPTVVDPHRIGDLVNGFIAAKQGALFDASDAFYRQTGGDAVAGGPAVAQRLADLRDATLEQATDDGERQALQTQLDAQLADALDGIDRHVAQYRDVRNREILSERQRLIERAPRWSTTTRPSSPASPRPMPARPRCWHGSMACPRSRRCRPRARRSGAVPSASDSPPARAVRRSTSSTGSTTSSAPATSGHSMCRSRPPARMRRLTPGSSARRQRTRAVGGAGAGRSRPVTRRESGHPRQDRGPRLRQGKRPYRHRAYEEAGETDKAGTIRRLAQREGFFQSFARSSAEAQQRLIHSLPAGDERAAAEAIQERQADAFAKDAFAAGTALYPDVGPPKPIDDIEERVKPSEMTKADAEAFIDEIMRSRDPRIATFLDMIHDKLQKYERSSGAEPRGGERK